MSKNYNNLNLNSLTFEEAKEIIINRAIMPNEFFNGDAWRHAVKKISDMLENGELQEVQTGHCKDCKWWKDSDGVYRRGIGAESQCPINRKEVYDGNGYCFLFEKVEE